MKTTSQNSRFTVAALLGVASLLSIGCAASGRISDADRRQQRSARTVTDTWATETPAADVRLRQDANGAPRAAGSRRAIVTGSLIPQDFRVAGNSADTASPVQVYGQGDLRRRGRGGFSTAESLSAVDPSITVGGQR